MALSPQQHEGSRAALQFPLGDTVNLPEARPKGSALLLQGRSSTAIDDRYAFNQAGISHSCTRTDAANSKVALSSLYSAKPVSFTRSVPHSSAGRLSPRGPKRVRSSVDPGYRDGRPARSGTSDRDRRKPCPFEGGRVPWVHTFGRSSESIVSRARHSGCVKEERFLVCRLTKALPSNQRKGVWMRDLPGVRGDSKGLWQG